MRAPCDEAVVRSTAAAVPCAAESRTWILAATILASSLAFIDSTVVNVALPAMQSSFRATLVGVQWVVESYGLFLGALILVGGSLGDLLGRRKIFLVGVVTFALASLASALATSINQLIVARSVQGGGAALLVPGSLAIISASFDERSRGRAIGTWSGFTSITTAIGPVIGGWLVEHASWRAAFFINLPIAVAVLAISVKFVPESRSATAGHIDWLGTFLGTLGLGALVVGFIASANLGWRNPLVLGSLLLGLSSLLAFVFIQARISSPIVPLAIFRSAAFRGANLLTLSLYGAIGIFFFLLPMNLIQVQGYSATATGAALLPMILLMFSLSRWSGGLVASYGPRLPLIAGPLIAALGFVLFAAPATASHYWKTFFPAIIVLGFGMAVTVAPLTTVVMNSVDQDRVGTASGINNAVARVAGVLAIAVFGIVMVDAFGSRLNRSLANLSLAPETVQQLQANEIRLAGLQVPTGLAPSTAAAVKNSIAEAFVFGFRLVMAVCAGLCAVSAVIAWRFTSKAASSAR
ncbi:MAG TPA: MFS transporter [Terriglobales bacterium]|nr:MFS transporter [Terriglobales bacterium]